MARTQAVENLRALVRVWRDVDGLTLVTIAEWLGVTYQRVGQIYRAAGGQVEGRQPRPYELHALKSEERLYRRSYFETRQARAHRARFMRAHGYVVQYVDRDG